MLRNLLIVSTILSVCTCTADTKRDKVSLKGDWILIRDTTETFSGDNVGLRFTNNTLSKLNNSTFWPQSWYILTRDTIFIEEFDGIKSFYAVLNYTPDSLMLSRNGHIERYYNKQLEYNPYLELDSIVLETGWCFGNCPNFRMAVHQNGIIRFEGFENVKVIGERKLRMESESLDKLDSLFKWSYIDHLDTTKHYGSIDGWSTEITFYYNEHHVTKVEGTMIDMPFRLRKILSEMTDFLREEELI